MNILGYIALSISNAAFLYSETIREQYRERNAAGLENSVRFNDLVFAVHALVLSLVAWTMFWPRLWGWDDGCGGRGRERRISEWVGGVGVGCLTAVGAVLLIVLMKGDEDARVGWAWIDVVSIQSPIPSVYRHRRGKES